MARFKGCAFLALVALAGTLTAQQELPPNRLTAQAAIMTESEFSMMVNDMASEIHPAVRSASVEFLANDRMRLQVRADFDLLANVIGPLQFILRGLHDLSADISFDTGNGAATVKVEVLRIDGLELPESLRDMLVRSVASRFKPPFEISEPFTLPDGIASVTIRQKNLVLQLAAQ